MVSELLSPRITLPLKVEIPLTEISVKVLGALAIEDSIVAIVVASSERIF